MLRKSTKFRAAALSLIAAVVVVAGLITFGPVNSTFAQPAMKPVVPGLAPAVIDPGSASLPTSGSFAPVVEQSAPAVVAITTTSVVKVGEGMQGLPFFFGRPGQPEEQRRQGAGSGVIITSDGYILTNHHVVEGAQEIEVAFSDKRTLPARVIGSDEKTDVAVLKVDSHDLPTLPLGNSDSVRVGDIVLAIGNPFGIGSTVTMGIVGATGRSGLGIEDYEDFIQTDAAINPGNSGGALINTKGQLVGINTAILSRTGGNNGVGFAVPINMGHHVMSQILEHGEVQRGYLGVGIQDLTPAMAKAFNAKVTSGAVIGGVTEDGPAGGSGLKRGDIVVGLNGKPVKDSRKFRLDIASTAPGTEVALNVLRDGKNMDIPVKLGRFPGSESSHTEEADTKSGSYGLTVTELTPEIARELDLAPDAKGVVIAQVQPGSAAAEAGLNRGDVIQEANRKSISNVDAFRNAAQSTGKEPLLLLVNRGGSTRYVVLERR